MKPIRDREARDRAAFSEENVAVTAGAGTGKTTLLVDAVMGRLLVRGVTLRRVLMLTFTEKAAAEMRIRLESRLRALLDPVSDEDHRDRKRWDERAGSALEERARSALAEIDRAEISTIHGFCAHFLREFPIEAGLVPSFTVDEGPKFEELFECEWGRWLDLELKADAPRRAEWLRVLAKAKLGDLREVAAGLSSFHVPDGALDPERALEAGQRKLLHAVTELSGRLESIAARNPGENRLKKQLIQVSAYLQSPTPEGYEELPDKPSEEKKGWPPGTYDAAQDLMAEALPLAADLARLDSELLADALGLVSTFARTFRASFVREGWIGFDGLLIKARDLLASTDFPEVREQAKRKYDFVVVDEFQDTDPVQCEIALFLAEEAGRRAPDAASVRLARGKLFIVGDPKQSIYSFRGADIVAYERLKDRILALGGSRERLETSFRSHSGILGTVNALFRTIIAKRGEVQPEYEEIFAVEGRDPAMPSQKVEALLFHGDGGKFTSEHARGAEGGAIADWIAGNVGKLEIPDRDPGSKRPLRLRDVAILLRALTDVHLLLDRLRSRGVRFVVEGEKYSMAQEVIDSSTSPRSPIRRATCWWALRSRSGPLTTTRC
jgi:ATP-dependent helicase/nuclease subunit A